MFRKTTLALATIASLSAAALVPTMSSAKPFNNHHWGHGHGFRGGFGVTIVDTSDASCWQLVKIGRNTYQRQNVCDNN